MANGNPREFINTGILGSGATKPQERGFHAIPTENIGTPEYDSRFFETFPTAWASAYTFTRSLEAGDRQALEEWASLFLLHYFGTAHLTFYESATLQDRHEYDSDLWLALNGTYPDASNGSLQELGLLATDDGNVVGGYYPEVVFFPARGNDSWGEDTVLKNLLTRERRLSWAKCSNHLLKTEADRRDFHLHLRRVAETLPDKKYRDLLRAFCAETFPEKLDYNPAHHSRLDRHPRTWTDIPGNKAPKDEEFLKRYPLRKQNKEGGYNYYLVTGLTLLSPWMTAATEAGWPAPNQYTKLDEKHIGVKFAGKSVSCELKENKDKIVFLKELFLPLAPYWCKVARATDTTKLRGLHRVELQDSVLSASDIAVCLAPVTREFLGHFPDVLSDASDISATPAQDGSVTWSFQLPGASGSTLEVRWNTKPFGSLDMPNTALALWPPKTSRRWKLYVAFGQGSKKTAGRWHLVDETGWQGTSVELEEPATSAEYISILQKSGETPNRPRALLFTDNNNLERGVLFLTDLGDASVGEDLATLAVDFGTSNTCVAYSSGGKAEVLQYSQSPEMLWGERPQSDQLGFVPFKWSGEKGFYPTILLSRVSDDSLPNLSADQLTVEHLFKVDMPGLHKGAELNLFTREGMSQIWRIHPNLKWDPDPKTPWRSLFLELTLLYAHAELFFNRGMLVNRYVFTYPLAFTKGERQRYHEKSKEAIAKVRQLCYRLDPQLTTFEYVDSVDESTAIAEFIRQGAGAATMEVFIDVGGGTADIAIRHNRDFLVLDSIRVAGNTFFRIAERNFKQNLKGASQFKKHLNQLLQGNKGKDVELAWPPPGGLRVDLNTYYSVFINQVSNQDFRNREEAILKDKTTSYQKYRALLLFRHILAYALLQACAAAVAEKISLPNGIKLILGGNAWGLMGFAGLARDEQVLAAEARDILKLLQRFLVGSLRKEEVPYIEGLKIFSVDLLSEEDLSRAKVGVALGALDADPNRRGRSDNTQPYTGISLKQLRVNDFDAADMRWCERWGFEQFKVKFGAMDQINQVDFEKPADLSRPLDQNLSVFSCLGNAGRRDQDIMPNETWNSINAEIIANIMYLQGENAEQAPVNHFLSKVLYSDKAHRDFLDTLAEKNNNY